MLKQIPHSDAPPVTRDILTEKNKFWKKYYWNHITEITRLENKFGNCLGIPLDIPKIEVPENFVNSYFEQAKYSFKKLPDIAGPTTLLSANRSTEASSFISIDSEKTSHSSIWTKNFQQDFITEYKDIFDQINEYLPLASAIQSFTLWSSTQPVNFHRDDSSFLDLPTQFRVLLHLPTEASDTTLRLQTSAPNQQNCNYFKITMPAETNSMAWNNLRVVHGSTFTGHKKILFIPTCPLNIDWKKYEDLLDRSIRKYRSFAFIDTYEKEHYIHD